jgi:hypothetical protein
MSEVELWRFLPLGYALTVLIEAPILFFGLSPRHDRRERLIAGFWLTACTYPIVVLVLPIAMRGAAHWIYLLVAETFAPAAECGLFYFAYGRGRARSVLARDFTAIVFANLLSFWLGWLFLGT